MLLETLVVGPLSVNCYIFACEKTHQAAIVDPGDEADQILSVVKKLDCRVKYILLTHGHIDHLSQIPILKNKLKAEFLMHEQDIPLVQSASTQAALFGLPDPGDLKPDRFLNDGDIIHLGELTIQVIHSPGHSPGSITFQVNQKLFVGDLIFNGSIGRTDLPGGDYSQIIESIQKKIFTLPDSVEIYPGHGPATTVGIEKNTNPFFN